MFYIPDTVKSVGNWAFRDCAGLKIVNIPASVETIGSNAFSGCKSLTSVTVPYSVTDIGAWAFSGCSSLESITLPFVGEKADGTGYTAFGHIFGRGPYGSENANVPASLKYVEITDASTIAANAFAGCNHLVEVILPTNLAVLKANTFGNCTNLSRVSFPQGIRTVESGAFRGCSALTTIVYNGSSTQWKSVTKSSGWIDSTSNVRVTYLK